jgi:hypothetical protein
MIKLFLKKEAADKTSLKNLKILSAVSFGRGSGQINYSAEPDV